MEVFREEGGQERTKGVESPSQLSCGQVPCKGVKRNSR